MYTVVSILPSLLCIIFVIPLKQLTFLIFLLLAGIVSKKTGSGKSVFRAFLERIHNYCIKRWTQQPGNSLDLTWLNRETADRITWPGDRLCGEANERLTTIYWLVWLHHLCGLFLVVWLKHRGYCRPPSGIKSREVWSLGPWSLEGTG